MKYELTISSYGYPLSSVMSDDLKEAAREAHKAGKALFSEGRRGLEVTWEECPEEDMETVMGFVFPWEFIDD